MLHHRRAGLAPPRALAPEILRRRLRAHDWLDWDDLDDAAEFRRPAPRVVHGLVRVEDAETVLKEPEAALERVEVQLRTIEGKTGSLTAHCKDSLKKLKMRISQLWNIPEAQQKLVVNGTEVLNDLHGSALRKRIDELFPKAEEPLTITLTVVLRQPEEATAMQNFLNLGHLLRYESDFSFSRWVPKPLQGSRDVLRSMAHLRVDWLRFADPEVLQDPKFFHDLLEDGVRGAFSFANEELQRDRGFVMKTVSRDWEAVRFIDATLLADREIALALVRGRGRALELLQPELRGDKELVLAAMRDHPAVLRLASASLCAEPGFVAEAVSLNPEAFHFASAELRQDPHFILSLLEQNRAHAPMIFDAVSQELGRDLDFVVKAAAINPAVLHALDIEDKDFLLSVAAATRAYEDLRDHLSSFGEADFLDLIARDAAFLEHVDRRLSFDRSFVLKAVKRNPAALDYATFALRSDGEVQAAAKAAATPEEQVARDAKRQRCQ